jgi:hypothetical protein
MMKLYQFSILTQHWVHNETFQDVSTEVTIACHAATLADSCFDRQKLPLSWQNMYHMQCTIAEHHITSRPKWWKTWILPSPYPIIIRSCSDMLRTSTNSMPYIKIQTKVTHYVAISLAFLLTHVFYPHTQKKTCFQYLWGYQNSYFKIKPSLM